MPGPTSHRSPSGKKEAELPGDAKVVEGTVSERIGDSGMHSGLLRAWEEQGEFSPLGLEQGERRWVVAQSQASSLPSKTKS